MNESFDLDILGIYSSAWFHSVILRPASFLLFTRQSFTLFIAILNVINIFRCDKRDFFCKLGAVRVLNYSGPTHLVTPLNLCILFQCKLYKFCLKSGGKILVKRNNKEILE